MAKLRVKIESASSMERTTASNKALRYQHGMCHADNGEIRRIEIMLWRGVAPLPVGLYVFDTDKHIRFTTRYGSNVLEIAGFSNETLESVAASSR